MTGGVGSSDHSANTALTLVTLTHALHTLEHQACFEIPVNRSRIVEQRREVVRFAFLSCLFQLAG